MNVKNGLYVFWENQQNVCLYPVSHMTIYYKHFKNYNY